MFSNIFENTLNPSKYKHSEYDSLMYNPAYCPGNAPSFDKHGWPYIIVDFPFSDSEPWQSTVHHHYKDLMFLRRDGWHYVNIQSLIRNHFEDNGTLVKYTKKVEFIKNTDELFLLVEYKKESRKYELLLLTSIDYCVTFTITQLCAEYGKPFNRIATEHYSGHNKISWPLLIAAGRRRENEPEKPFKDFPGYLYYYIVDKKLGRITVSDAGILSEMASRNPIGSYYVTTQIVTTKQYTHIVWHDTDYNVERWGNKTYIKSYNRSTRPGVQERWTRKTYIGPSADDHGYPAICLDSMNYIHVLCGSHSDKVYYAISKSVNNSSDFKSFGPIEGIDKATHLSFVCDAKNRLHLAFRDTTKDEHDKRGLSYAHADVAEFKIDRPNRVAKWYKPVRLANSPQTGYCRMCNRLSIDKQGRLYLNYGYYTLDYNSEGSVTGWYYPILVRSIDRGKTWQLVPDDFSCRNKDSRNHLIFHRVNRNGF